MNNNCCGQKTNHWTIFYYIYYYYLLINYKKKKKPTTAPTTNKIKIKRRREKAHTSLCFNTLLCLKIQLVVQEMATETPLLLDTIEKAVDYKGRPVLRSNSGGWRSASFIIGKQVHGDYFASFFFFWGIKKYTCMMGLLYI